MPELPEVETIKNDLRRKIIGKKITEVEARSGKTIRGEKKKFIGILRGNRFGGIERIGKLLIFALGDGKNFLLVHLKMTGQLVFISGKEIIAGGHSFSARFPLPNKYSRVIFGFEKGEKLFFNDMRRFGYMEIVGKNGLEMVKNKYGIEPLSKEFKPEKLKEIFKNRRAPVKAALMNQKLIAGIGNIYADEILFAARVMPDRKAASLKDGEVKDIFSASRNILKKAVKRRGTTVSDYVDTSGGQGGFSKFLKVYGRRGEKCYRCARTVKSMKIAGRSANFCDKCQK